MTRIKKRRTGKKRTADQKKLSAGRRKGKATEQPAVDKEQTSPKNILTAEQKAAYKKSLQPVQSSRRNRSSKNNLPAQKAKTDFTNKQDNYKTGLSGKRTGKTRSAGSRRIAVAKSVATNFKNTVAHKKVFPQKKEINVSAEGKPRKGFAPWNKNKFKRKNKQAE
jgi:hypothetical protein